MIYSNYASVQGLTFTAPCITNVGSSATNKKQSCANYLFLWNALHVSGGSSAHHQELKLYIQHRVLCQTFTARSLSLPRQWQVAVKVWQSTRCCIYSFWAPDDGRRNRLKHVEHFTEINKLCNVASCWLHLKIRFRCTDPWNSNILKFHNNSSILNQQKLQIRMEIQKGQISVSMWCCRAMEKVSWTERVKMKMFYTKWRRAGVSNIE